MFGRTLGVAAMAAILAAGGPAMAQVRVGTYDFRAVAVAMIRSDVWAAELAEKHGQMKAAEAAGDKAQMAELKQWGADHQRRAHLMGFAGIAVEDPLLRLAAQLPDLAKAHDLDLIVTGSLPFRGPDVEIVDLTDDLAALYNADAQTLRIIADLRTKPPVPLEAVLSHKD